MKMEKRLQQNNQHIEEPPDQTGDRLSKYQLQRQPKRPNEML